MKLRRFTAAGIQAFEEYLSNLEANPTTAMPSVLLLGGDTTEPVANADDFSTGPFASRMRVAKHLVEYFDRHQISDDNLDLGVWSWLSLALFDSICPPGRGGIRKIRERAAYVPQKDNYRRYYRHLLLGPYLIYRAHQDDPARANCLLCKPPHIIDDVVAQIAASQELVTNPGIVKLATDLFYDPVTGSLRIGAGGKGPGSARRLVMVLKQFDVTWDLYGMSDVELRRLMPVEFRRHLPN